ncbi:MAG: hypothetical protein ACI38U_08570 [Corynebacterium sp.]|uniref:hypothetical protein n=1 Tax=unclassified Corynebacterium TaxID=2624378 RepID=UPI0009675EBF|nr:hypothetical protein [Corynebacterium sp. CNJ-954]OLT52792.1 hypothetical protein BJF89_04875 [Corynebacterium sp. CNJ-954]
MSAQHVKPDVLKKLGIRHPRRILQAHIDDIGTVVNPALFFPLAFRAAAEKTLTYRVVSVASFTCVSVSLVAAVLQY